MIIWSGLGFLVAVFAFGCSLAMNLATNAIFNDESYYTSHKWPLAIALAVAGILNWSLGQFLNARQSRVFIDKVTGHEVVIEPNHSLFFIKMQGWGPILVVLGIASLFFK